MRTEIEELPDFSGQQGRYFSLTECIHFLNENNLSSGDVRWFLSKKTGGGIVVEQRPAPGRPLKLGQVLELGINSQWLFASSRWPDLSASTQKEKEKTAIQVFGDFLARYMVDMRSAYRLWNHQDHNSKFARMWLKEAGFGGLVDYLLENEADVFFRLVPQLHKLRGKAKGIEWGLRLFLHLSPDKITVQQWQPNQQVLAANKMGVQISKLGSQFHNLGQNWVIGADVVEALSHLRISIGLLDYPELNRLVNAGWIQEGEDGYDPTEKLSKLAECFVPFWVDVNWEIIIPTKLPTGWILGESSLAEKTLLVLS